MRNFRWASRRHLLQRRIRTNSSLRVADWSMSQDSSDDVLKTGISFFPEVIMGFDQGIAGIAAAENVNQHGFAGV